MENCRKLRDAIRTIPDFPAKGIMFRDVTTLMKDGSAFNKSCDCMELASREFEPFEIVAGIEARGFIYGSVLSFHSQKGFVPIRKPGKLPAETMSMDYDLEYGKDTLEMHTDAVLNKQRCLVVDDLLATGGTAEAACRLIEKSGGIVVGCLFLVELPDLDGRIKLKNRKVNSIIQFEGE